MCTKRTAQQRYEKALARREQLIAENPKVDAAVSFLERHWPYLINAIESCHVPRTDNATEQVDGYFVSARIFTQHKAFCGFESIDTARLGRLREGLRFTSFSNDGQERIRGKCPLELAGYEVQKLPMA